MVGLFHAGPQLRRPADLFIPGYLGGWLALFRLARKPQALAVDLGEAQHRRGLANHFSLPAQRRLFGAEADSGWAVESAADPKSRRSPNGPAISVCIPSPPPISGGRETR